MNRCCPLLTYCGVGSKRQSVKSHETHLSSALPPPGPPHKYCRPSTRCAFNALPSPGAHVRLLLPRRLGPDALWARRPRRPPPPPLPPLRPPHGPRPRRQAHVRLFPLLPLLCVRSLPILAHRQRLLRFHGLVLFPRSKELPPSRHTAVPRQLDQRSRPPPPPTVVTHTDPIRHTPIPILFGLCPSRPLSSILLYRICRPSKINVTLFLPRPLLPSTPTSRIHLPAGYVSPHPLMGVPPLGKPRPRLPVLRVPTLSPSGHHHKAASPILPRVHIFRPGLPINERAFYQRPPISWHDSLLQPSRRASR